jgi:hypothetical protein
LKVCDDLIDPDPPRPGLETLANVSERARRMRRRRDATRVLGLGAVAGLLVGSLAFVIDGDPDQPSEIAVSLDTSADVAIDLGELLGPTTPPETETPATVSATATTESPAASGSLPVEQTTTTTTMPLPIEPIPFLAVTAPPASAVSKPGIASHTSERSAAALVSRVERRP